MQCQPRTCGWNTPVSVPGMSPAPSSVLCPHLPLTENVRLERLPWEESHKLTAAEQDCRWSFGQPGWEKKVFVKTVSLLSQANCP